MASKLGVARTMWRRAPSPVSQSLPWACRRGEAERPRVPPPLSFLIFPRTQNKKRNRFPKLRPTPNPLRQPSYSTRN